MKIGERIKAKRVSMGLTVDQLADRIGKNRATIYRYENGDIENLPISVLGPLADALGLTPADLFGREQPKDMYSKDEEMLIEKYRQLGAGDKEKVHDFIDYRLYKAASASEQEEENLG